MKLDCGIVIYVKNRLILKINQNILNSNLINTKRKIVLLLMNMNLLDQTLKR